MPLEHIRPWLLMEMNHCTLPKAIVEQFLRLFDSDGEIVGVLRGMLSLYQVNQTAKKEPINALERLLSALTVDKPRSKRAESFCQDVDWLAKKPRVRTEMEGVPVMKTEETEELCRFAVSLTEYYSAGKSESLFRRLNPLTFLRLWRMNANSFYQNRQLFVYFHRFLIHELSEISSILLLHSSSSSSSSSSDSILLHQLLFALVNISASTSPFQCCYNCNLDAVMQRILFHFLRTSQRAQQSALLADLALCVLLNHAQRAKNTIGFHGFHALMVDIREFSDAIDALPPSEFRKALKAFVVKGKGPVPTRFPHEGKRSLRDFVDLAAKEKEVGIEQAVSAVLNQEIESLFVNVKWSEIAALNETQRQFALFVLQMEAAMHSFVEVQIERRIDEELDLGPLEEKTLDVMEDVISILYSLSASPRRREEIRRLQEQCYCTIWHVCFEEMSAILEQCQTAEELLQQQQTAFLTTGCRSIDKCLKGGIPLHSITEVCGLLVVLSIDNGRIFIWKVPTRYSAGCQCILIL